MYSGEIPNPRTSRRARSCDINIYGLQLNVYLSVTEIAGGRTTECRRCRSKKLTIYLLPLQLNGGEQ